MNQFFYKIEISKYIVVHIQYCIMKDCIVLCDNDRSILCDMVTLMSSCNRNYLLCRLTFIIAGQLMNWQITCVLMLLKDQTLNQGTGTLHV